MTLVATIIGAGVSVEALAAPSCQALFEEKPLVITPEVSRSETTEKKFSFMPGHVRLTKKSGENYIAEYVYSVRHSPLIKRTEVAMDSANVIDANLNSGRELLESILDKRRKDRMNGTFIFVDVNNLSWVNRNFADKMQAGDLYIAKTVEALRQVVAQDGLIFRLGGDEFGIVLDTHLALTVQQTIKKIQNEIHERTHSIFLQETKRRVLEFREFRKRYKQGEFSEAEYVAKLAEFKEYTMYSQEGVSMGAAYIDGSPAEAIQNLAERMATHMKIKIKKAFNLDTSKYTGGVNLSNNDKPIQPKFRSDFPLMATMGSKQPVTKWTNSRLDAIWSSNVPVVQSTRSSDVVRFGQIGIGKYHNELTLNEYKLEVYDVNNKIIETRLIEINTNTQFMDARSKAAKTVINEFIDHSLKPGSNGVTLQVSLLNLGKLNYFHNKTATGDQALQITAEILREVLTANNIPFKANGSDFLILSVGTTKEEINNYKKSLETKLNAHSSLDVIFLKEIEHIQESETNPQVRQKRIEEVRKLMSKKFQVF
jgi:GGDEF domain-containing protein